MLGVIVVVELVMVITAGLGVAATVLATRMFQMDRKTVEFDSDLDAFGRSRAWSDHVRGLCDSVRVVVPPAGGSLCRSCRHRGFDGHHAAVHFGHVLGAL